MKYYIFSYAIFVAFILGACINANKERYDTIIETDTVAPLLENTPEEALDEDSSIYFNPLNVSQIKKKYEASSTSGILSNSKSYKYYKPKEDGFYGFYILISEGVESSPLGQLVIFNDEKPWWYDNATDIFVAVIAVEKGISVFGDLEVGSTELQLENRLGSPYKKNDNLTIYKDDKTKTIALFRLKDKKITWFRIGKYSDAFYHNIDENIHELL